MTHDSATKIIPKPFSNTNLISILLMGMNTKQQFLIPKLETNQKPKSSMLSSTQFELKINDAIFSDIKLRKNKSNKKLSKKKQIAYLAVVSRSCGGDQRERESDGDEQILRWLAVNGGEEG